ncbi:MAG: hypothetical protein HDQ88_04110 [Clostridia bacterium]|nr:hypothetical protein [Clostridia bacterium]
MKTVKSLFKVTVALIMAFALMTLTACDVINGLLGKGDNDSDKDSGSTGDNKEYTVTLNVDGGTLSEELTKYTSGKAVQLPDAVKAHYEFEGWYPDDSLSGNPVTTIKANEKGNKTFYAKWKAETYSVSFTIKDDASYTGSLTSYTYNVEASLPTPTKTGSAFNGWYENESLTGSPETKIAKGQYGDKHYYGEWITGSSVVIRTVTLELNGGTLKGSNVTSYIEGKEVTLPQAEKSGYTFEGWYTNSNFTGSPVEKILSTDKGNKTFYAKFDKITTTNLSITSYAGYEEGAYVEFPVVGSLNKSSDYTVSYKGASDSKFTNIDSALIRVNNTEKTVRADIVGLKKESAYTIKVEAGSQSKEVSVTTKAYDRSGYAHFNYTSGVGAYNDDGTPKKNAVIVYVDEATKNTVKATVNGSTRTGIVSILQNAGTSTPLIVRIIGTVGAATWNHVEESTQNKDGSYVPITPDKVKGTSKTTTLLKKYVPEGTTKSIDISQDTLISDGFNTLDESVYTKLNGLNSKAKYDASKDEFDSAWNDCSISGVKNVTVEGIGTDARIFQWGMTFKNCNSIEVRNLTFEDYTEDACSFEGGKTSASSFADFDSKNFWVHHNTFEEGMNYWDVCNEQDKHDGDGSTDFKGLSNVTISYNNYNGTHKTGLIGGSNSQTTANITFHHNYYNGCKSRLPLARQANMHMYNNYYHATTGTDISLRAGAYALVENCYFSSTKSVNFDMQVDSTYGNGAAKVIGCVFAKKNISYASGYDKSYFKEDVSRSTTISNDNKFNKKFDTDSTVFYYENGQSKVEVMHTAEQTKSLVPTLAGVHKN